MSESRRIDICVECGETREMAILHLCFTCYRRHRRAQEEKGLAFDKHTPAVRKENLRLKKGFLQLLQAAHGLSLRQQEVNASIRIAAPHLEPISSFVEAILLYDPTATDSQESEKE
jgi:hypothetical protein